MESIQKITDQNLTQATIQNSISPKHVRSQNGIQLLATRALATVLLTGLMISGASALAGTERASGAYSSARGFLAPQAGVKSKKRKPKPQTRVIFSDEEAVQFEVVERDGHQEVVMAKSTSRGSSDIRASL